MITISKFQRRHRHWRYDSYEKDDPLMQGDLCHWKIAVAISVIRHQAIPGRRRDVRRAPHRLHWNQLRARARKGIIIIKKVWEKYGKSSGEKRGCVTSLQGWVKLPPAGTQAAFCPLSSSVPLFGKKQSPTSTHPRTPKTKSFCSLSAFEDSSQRDLISTACVAGL